MLRGPRIVPRNLSAAERRVLDAFYAGRLPAGKLSAALTVARGAETRRAQQPAEAAAPALRLAA